MKRVRLAFRTLANRRVWYWRAFYDPQFGWFKFGAGFWIKYLFTIWRYRKRKG